MKSSAKNRIEKSNYNKKNIFTENTVIIKYAYIVKLFNVYTKKTVLNSAQVAMYIER